MANFTNKTFRETYRDFYKEGDNYHKVLFNSGKALQARELNELQSIIQEEIARFGRNIFREGALVQAGGVLVDNAQEYIRIDSTSVIPADLVGQTYQNTAGLQFEILEVVDSTPTDPVTLYVKYTDTSTAVDNSIPARVAAGDVLTPVGSTVFPLTVASDVNTIPSSGTGTRVSVNKGVFFALGHFVAVQDSSTYVDKYSSTPTCDFGFRVEQKIITEGEDVSLYDNQGDFPNTSSPGAHRYQINLIPSTRDQVADDENFVFVARIVDGVITRDADTNDAYNTINDLLATRTKEESGDYVAKQFKTIFSDYDENHLELEVTAGTAYVDGYRLDFPNTKLLVDKSRATNTVNNDSVAVQYGNYVVINPATSSGIPSLSSFGSVDLVDSGSQTIGTANVRALELVGTEYRLFLFNIEMGFGNNFRDVVRVVDGTSSASLASTPAVLYGSANNSLLFPLSNERPQSISDTNYTAQYVQQYSSDASGSILLGGTLNPSYNWVLFETDGTVATGWSFDSATSKIVNLTPQTAYVVAYYVQVSNPAVRSKVVTEVTETGISLSTAGPVEGPVYGGINDFQNNWAIDAAGTARLWWNGKYLGSFTNQANTTTLIIDGYKYIRGALQGPVSTLGWDGYELSRTPVSSENDVIELDYADGIELISIVDDEGNDLTNSFIFDGGQRDNFYGPIKLSLQPGLTLEPDTTLTVTFNHFAHTAGQYFSVESYNIPYGDIPKHTLASGRTISLVDVLDFRPVITASGISQASINPLPKNSSIISVDATYYLPRVDVLVANTIDSKGRKGIGELQVIKGESSLQAREPKIPAGSLALYRFHLNAYTFDSSDQVTTHIPNKRFTMKDIAKLESRVDTLFELTTLSLLEASTNSLMILDENGNNRTKSGFIADNFSSLNFSDINSTEYRASVELSGGEVRPPFRENSIRLAMRASGSTASKLGDMAILPYTHELMSSQLLATSTMNVNPFAVITQTGHMTLSPASDEWVETTNLPDVLQTTVRRVSFEETQEDLARAGGMFGGAGRGAAMVVRTIERDIQEFLGETVVDVEVIPFMRSRKIYFKAAGLRPNTKMFAFFGGRDVSSWVRQENTFVTFSDNAQEVGGEFVGATQHPDGPTELITDSRGELIGSFLLPNTSTISFRTGQQEFKLLDVSVNDDDAAICKTNAIYESTGTIESVQRTIRTTRVVEEVARRVDPLAQSFFIDQVENPNGLYLTKVRIFMESKDSTIPLQVQIRPVENGVPTTRIVPGSVKFIDPSDINVTPLTATTEIADIRANGTDIEFDEPIYLTSGEEYAIILLAESVGYNTYVAETYEYIIGNNNAEGRVNKQPTLGSLFTSQNGSTWTPDQTRDLMFEMYRADFAASGTLYLENTSIPKRALRANPISVEKGINLAFIRHEGHGFVKNDKVLISGVSGNIGGVDNTFFNGLHTIVDVNWRGYSINIPTPATASITGGGNAVVASEQLMYDEFVPHIDTLTPRGTAVTAQVQKMTGSSYGNARNDEILNGAYATVPYTQVFMNELNRNESPALIANGDNHTGASITFKLEMSTTDTKVSPMVDLQRVSMLGIENVIDAADAAQHITTPVIIDESAVGLKVLFGANRPSGASFELYIKTATDETGLSQAEWVLADQDSEMPSDDNMFTFREYTYTVNDIDPFNIFQVKIVMKSNNTSKSPAITDLRTIALAV